MRSSSTAHTGLKRALACLVVVAVVVIAVIAASFALCPYGSKSEVSWTELRAQQGIDAVCLGSSLAGRCVDPSVIDERCGTNLFNMSTPSQYVSESVAGLRTALRDQPVKRVFYGVDFSMFSYSYTMYPGRVYLNEKWKGEPFQQRFADLAYVLPDAGWLFTDKSLNWLFPFVEQHVEFSARLVAQNVKMKLDGTTVLEAATVNEPGWNYQEKGYGNYDQVFDFNGDTIRTFGEECGTGDLDDVQLRYLADLCDLCAERGIELVAFVPPLPDFSIISMSDRYERFTTQARDLVVAHGGVYCDFNLAKPELFDSQERYYFDHQHCNAVGGEALSTSLARFVNRVEAGEDTSGLFYTYDEKLASIDDISAVTLAQESVDGGIRFTATCYAGSTVVPEYEYAVKVGEGDYVVVREYADDASFTFEPAHIGGELGAQLAQAGACTVQVRVRPAGSSAPFEKHTQHAVAFAAGGAR